MLDAARDRWPDLWMPGRSDLCFATTNRQTALQEIRDIGAVRMGLAALGGCDFVLIHDAARPLATAALVRRVLAAAMESGAAFPAIAPRDAVKRVEGNRLAESLDRSRIVLAQTPQAFAYGLLARAHREAADAGLVGDDDAQLVAATGHLVTVVPGEPANLKLTTPEDLEVVEALIREHETAPR